MSKYYVWLTAYDGEGIPQALEEWDDEQPLTLRLSAFAPDAVITIESKPEVES